MSPRKAVAVLAEPRATPTQAPARPPARAHTAAYHRPLLLDRPDDAASLLTWFDRAHGARDMPWRQAWIDPAKRARTEGDTPPIREQLKRRAYEVWISEIMLQQTRVESVKGYWSAWMERWPTIEALANASVDDVLSAWRGLGYYGRARRIHEAAQLVVHDPDMQGLLPADADTLCERIPGIGPYTAGAISSIVFGHAVPILDGNVARVLSRQSALYTDPKAARTTDLLWDMARRLVECAAGTSEPNDIPGRWNQGLMELGSTLCTPTKPDCAACPIQATCLAYAEGSACKEEAVRDVEDLCDYCLPVPDPSDTDEPHTQTPAPKKKALKQTTLFGAPPKPAPPAIAYAQLFPMRTTKKPPRIETRLVCVVRTSLSDGETLYLLTQRPHEGLLARLWEFPTTVLPEALAPSEQCKRACAFMRELALPAPDGKSDRVVDLVTQVQTLGDVAHEFSHLRWHMHLVLLDVSISKTTSSGSLQRLDDSATWVNARAVEAASMGTGLRRCWARVLQHSS